MAATDSEDAATEAEGEYLEEVAYVIPEADDMTCSICYAEFLDSEDLQMHVEQMHKVSTAKKGSKARKHVPEKPVTFSKVCQLCDASYQDADAYARHICDDHIVSLFCCRVCTKCFTDGAQWKKHEKKHKNKGNTYACSQCSAVFSLSKQVEVHEKVNHDNQDDGTYLTCMQSISALLKQNAIAFLQSDDRNFNCAACKFTSEDLDSFFGHSKKCTVYVCDICCYVTNAKKYLLKHYYRKNKCKRPEDCESEMTRCMTCKMKVHCRQMHIHLNNCNKYKCYVCDIRFMSIESLSAHQSEAHPVELDVIRCKFCFKEFVGDNALDKHVTRSHSHQFILYKYKCMQCEQIFKHPQLLFAHYFTKHKDLEPYTCRICNKKFKVRKRFTIHIKLEHKSNGVVEFDSQYHVFFAEKKSENPFIPKCVIPELVPAKTSQPSIKVKTHHEINAEADKKKLEEELPTETEVDEEKSEGKSKQKPKAKKRKRNETVDLSSSEEEVEPLSLIKKRTERKHFQKRFTTGKKNVRQRINQRKQFTCKVCNKYCYTFQNYQNHIQIHKKENIKCIKCSETFKSRNKLSEHMVKDHATSKLIETLKNVRERKQVETSMMDPSYDDRNEEELTVSERFMRTIKKVKLEKQIIPAMIGQGSGNVSVRNFIENFVPETGESANVESSQEQNEGKTTVTLRHYDSPFYRKHSIKMTRFTPESPQMTVKLKMPEKFKSSPQEKVKLKVKLVQEPLKESMFESTDTQEEKFTFEDHQYYHEGDHVLDDYDDNEETVIPEVAQEVLLEGSDEPPKPAMQMPHKIVIPKLPDGYPKIHIATLQHQAPFFKIITVKNSKNSNEAIVIDTDDIKEVPKEEKPIKRNDVISLPDGTKFVTANPLAHLLGGKPVEDILLTNKYYKPAPRNFQGIFAEALQNLDKPGTKAKRPRKKIVNNGTGESQDPNTTSQGGDLETKNTSLNAESTMMETQKPKGKRVIKTKVKNQDTTQELKVTSEGNQSVFSHSPKKAQACGKSLPLL